MSKVDLNYLQEMMSILPKLDLYELLEYHFIQHIDDDVESAQSEFIRYCVKIGMLPDKFLNAGTHLTHRQGIIGRYLDDSNHQINSIWIRFMCIDDMYREWSQPYYAFNYNDFWSVQPCYCVNNYPEIVQFYRDRKINKILKNV